MTTLLTSRLVLRPPRDGDREALVRGLNNFSVSQWTARIQFPYTTSDAGEFLSLTEKAPADVLRLAITHENELIGVIGIEAGEIGYWIAESHWGKGFGREAARAIADHAFTSLGLAALTARYRLGNAASRRILLDLGFVETGEAKGYSRATGGETDLMTLALSKAGWQKARERRQ